MRSSLALLAALALVLSACESRHPSQKTFYPGELNVTYAAEYGTVIGVEEGVVPHGGKRGALLGGAAGAAGGSYVGKSDGKIWATVGGALIGAVAGHYAESTLFEGKAYEYTLRMQSGETKIFREEMNDENHVFAVGEFVMLQYCDAGNTYVKRCGYGSAFQRIKQVDKLPPYDDGRKKHKRKKRKKIVTYADDAGK